MKCKSVYVVLNPASGQAQPVLKPIYLALSEANVEWEMWVSRSGEEMLSKIESAVRKNRYDAIAVYGGDGSIMAAAEKLRGRLPLIILPGGTGNVTARELQVPMDVGEAMAFGLDRNTKVLDIDMAKVGKKMFLQRLALGIEAEMVKGATRELKTKLGGAAYGAAFIKALITAPEVEYRLTLDGEMFEEKGILVRVDNTAAVGVGGLTLSKDTVMWDGLLDVMVVRHKDERAIRAFVASKSSVKQLQDLMFYRQAKKIKIEARRPMRIAADGEMWGKTPVEIEVKPGYTKIVGKKR